MLRFSTTSSLWLDEALSVNIAQLPAGDLVRWLRHDGHPPLYYLLLHVWTDVFGTGDVAVRAMSGVFGLLTLPLAWIAGRRRGGPLLGWIAVIVVALSPFAVRYADEARMYSMVMFLAFAGYLLVDDVLRRGETGLLRLAGITVVTAALLYTHYWAPVAGGRRRTHGAVAGLAGAGAGRPVAAREGRRAPSSSAGSSSSRGSRRCSTSRPTPARRGPAPCVPPWPPRVTLSDFSSGLYADGAFFAILLGLLHRARPCSGERSTVVTSTSICTPGPSCGRRPSSPVITFGIGLAAVVRRSRAPSPPATRRWCFPFVALLVAGGVTRFGARWIRFGALLGLCAFLGAGALWNIADTRTQAGQIAAPDRRHTRSPATSSSTAPISSGPRGAAR